MGSNLDHLINLLDTEVEKEKKKNQKAYHKEEIAFILFWSISIPIA